MVGPSAKSREDKKWEEEFILTNSRSPLGNADLRAILCHPQAWAVLTKEEQKEILSLFPDDKHIQDPGTEQARPNIESLRNDNNFRHDCARYTEDLKGGYHDKEWLSEAWAAHEMRKAGIFDEYEARRFEEEWGVELPDEWKPASTAKEKESSEEPGIELGSEKSSPKSQTEGRQESHEQSHESSKEQTQETVDGNSIVVAR